MSWKGELLQDIHDNLSPNEFEKFVHNLLKNIGLSEIELLGQSDDGGIDLKSTWTYTQVAGLEINLNCKIQVKCFSPKTARAIKVLYMHPLGES